MAIKFKTRLVEAFKHGQAASALVKTTPGKYLPPPVIPPDINCIPKSLWCHPDSTFLPESVTYRINDGEMVTLRSPDNPWVSDALPPQEELRDFAQYVLTIFNIMMGKQDDGFYGANHREAGFVLAGIDHNGHVESPTGTLNLRGMYETMSIDLETMEEEPVMVKYDTVVPGNYKIEIFPTPDSNENDLYAIIKYGPRPSLPMEPAMARELMSPQLSVQPMAALADDPIIGISCAKYVPNYGPFDICDFESNWAQFYHPFNNDVFQWECRVDGVITEMNVEDRGDFSYDFSFTTPSGITVEGWSQDGTAQLNVSNAYSDDTAGQFMVEITMPTSLDASELSASSPNVKVEPGKIVKACLRPKHIRCSDSNSGYIEFQLQAPVDTPHPVFNADVTINEITYPNIMLYHDDWYSEPPKRISIGDTLWTSKMGYRGGFEMELLECSLLTPLKVIITPLSGINQMIIGEFPSGDWFPEEIVDLKHNPTTRFDQSTGSVVSCVKLKPCAGATSEITARVMVDGVEIPPQDNGLEVTYAFEDGSIPPCYYDVVFDGVSLNPDHQNLWDLNIQEVSYNEYFAQFRYDYPYPYPPQPEGTVHKVQLVPPSDGKGMLISRLITSEEADGGNYYPNPTYKKDEQGVISFCVRVGPMPT